MAIRNLKIYNNQEEKPWQVEKPSMEAVADLKLNREDARKLLKTRLAFKPL